MQIFKEFACFIYYVNNIAVRDSKSSKIFDLTAHLIFDLTNQTK